MNRQKIMKISTYFSGKDVSAWRLQSISVSEIFHHRFHLARITTESGQDLVLRSEMIQLSGRIEVGALEIVGGDIVDGIEWREIFSNSSVASELSFSALAIEVEHSVIESGIVIEGAGPAIALVASDVPSMLCIDGAHGIDRSHFTPEYSIDEYTRTRIL